MITVNCSKENDSSERSFPFILGISTNVVLSKRHNHDSISALFRIQQNAHKLYGFIVQCNAYPFHWRKESIKQTSEPFNVLPALHKLRHQLLPRLPWLPRIVDSAAHSFSQARLAFAPLLHNRGPTECQQPEPISRQKRTEAKSVGLAIQRYTLDKDTEHAKEKWLPHFCVGRVSVRQYENLRVK